MCEARPIRILFVCTGNSCRSPMAEAIMAARMPRGWRGRVVVSSAGTSAWDGIPAAPPAVAVLAEAGIDLSRHRSRRMTAEMIAGSDIVVAMEEAHREKISEIASGSRRKVIVFGELDPDRGDPNVPDPIGGDEGVYRRTSQELERLVALLITHLIAKYELK